MKSKTSNLVKGVGIGVAVGCTIGAMGSMYMRNNKKGLKKTFNKTMKNVSSIVDDVSSMF